MLTNDPIIHKNCLKDTNSRYQFHFIVKMGSKVEFKYKLNIDTTFVLGKPTETHPQIRR